MFWSGQELTDQKSKLILGKDPGTIVVDCASIELTIGSEVYVTPNSESDTKVKTVLTSEKSQFIIPKGQFALLLTEEIVYVPENAIAFISFKAKYKYKGLINVSGFHVDPGWKGKLTFSVFNAGPSDVVLEKGRTFALIWYADLMDRKDKEYTTTPEGSRKYTHVKSKDPVLNLSSDIVSDMTGDIFSPFKLKKEVEEIKEKYHKEMLDLRKEMSSLEGKLMVRYVLLIFASITLTLALFKILPQKSDDTNATTSPASTGKPNQSNIHGAFTGQYQLESSGE